MDSLWAQCATGLAAAIRARSVSSVELTKHLLSRVERINPHVNAIVACDGDAALQAARAADERLASHGPRGPLHGLPVTIKDTFETAGLTSACGTIGRAKHVPQADAAIVHRLKAAGAFVLGKTNVPEFAMAVETDNLVHGRTNNPYSLARTSGGSSGGPAAAVAAGLSPLDVGSDGGGSIRLPAHYCGVAGLKATTGRISQAGHFPEPYGPSVRIVSYGPIGRSIQDLRVVLSIVEGEDLNDPISLPIRVGVDARPLFREMRVAFFCSDGVCTPTRETVETIQRCARSLSEAGCRVEEAAPPDLGDAHEIHLGLIINDRHLVREWMTEANTTSAQLHPWTSSGLSYMDAAAEDLGPEFGTMLFYELKNYQKKALKFMRDYDVLLSPAAAFPAPVHGNGVSTEAYAGYGYSTLYNLTGWPAAVVRCGSSSDGLPIAAQVAALPFRDGLVLDVAEYLEGAMGGWQPPKEL